MGLFDVKNIKLLSIEECFDEAYGASIIQYQVGDVISFAFSKFTTEEIKSSPSVVLAELWSENNRPGERPLWSALSPKLLDAVLENPFDMHFVEYDDEGWSEKSADEVWDEASKYELGITRGEDNCLLTIYAGTMCDIDWNGHPLYGEPCFDQTITVLDILKAKVEAERKAFKESYVSGQSDPKRAYEDFYIIGFYEEYCNLLTSDYLEDRGLEKEISWLSSMDNPLSTLYNIWLDCDGATSYDWDDMIDFICVNCREISQEKSQSLEAQICEAEALKETEPERSTTTDLLR